MPVQPGEVSMTHEVIVGAYAFNDDDNGWSDHWRAGLEIVCECGAVLLDEPEDELLPFTEIADAVRSHQDACGGA